MVEANSRLSFRYPSLMRRPLIGAMDRKKTLMMNAEKKVWSRNNLAPVLLILHGTVIILGRR